MINWQKLWTHVHKYDVRDIFHLQPREGDITVSEFLSSLDDQTRNRMFVSVYHELVVGDCSDESYVHEYNSDMVCNSDIYHFEGYHWVSVNETIREIIKFAINHHFIFGEKMHYLMDSDFQTNCYIWSGNETHISYKYESVKSEKSYVVST